MISQQLEAPESEPLTLDEAKAHLRVLHDAEDDYIAGLIPAARQFCESRTSRQLLTATWATYLDEFPAGDSPIYLPHSPVQSVNAIFFTNEDGEFALDQFTVDAVSAPARVFPARGEHWPVIPNYPLAVRVEYDAGYGEAEDVPPAVRQAMLLLIAHWYENREAVLTGTISKNLELTVDALLATITRRGL